MNALRRALPLALALSATSPAWADASYHSLQAGAFTQDWGNAAQITTNDDWSGVASIIGLRGDALTSGTGIDPQTVVAIDAVVDVNANQTNPNTFITGGLTEFAIADPVVALAGSGTARAPSMLIHVDTTNRYNITVEYNLRDIDGSADNSIQPVALQYRIGSSGNFTNVPGAFVADASSGPNLATLVTPVSVTLPSAADNQPQVQLRIITTDAAGNDEWIGIDDIFIFGEPPPPPAVTVANVSVIEGNPPGTTTMTFTATLAQPIQDSCDFSVETFDSSPDATATPNVDYTPISLNLSIPAGDTSVTFDVPIIRDTDIEADEVLVIDVYGEPQTCDIFGIGAVFGTIVNDDAPDISINDISLFEGSGGGTTAAILTVSLDTPAPAGGVTVNYATANGTASAALADYAAASGTLTFVAGDDSETVTVNIAADDFFEADETLFVNLSGAVGGDLVDNQGQVTILNDDGESTLAIDTVAIEEGTGAGTTNLVFTVTASKSPAPGETITVDYASAGGSALSGTDFTAVNGTLTYTNGGTLTQTISVPIVRDNIDELDESFTVVLSNASNALIYIGTGVGSILDDDTAVVAVNNVSQAEGNSGTSSFNFTVSLSVPSASAREFVVYTADVSATGGSDYVGIPQVPGQLVHFPALNTAQPVSVTVNGDTDVEPDETFEVRVAPLSGAIEGNPTILATGTGTIVNDDVLVDVAINDVSVTEGTGAGSTNAVFTVTLSAQPPAGSPLVVNYATAGGTAVSGTDFTATAGTLTFSNGGALTQTISVPVTRDNIDENDEGFVVNISAPAANVTDAQGAGTILDDDTAVVSVSSPSQNEGNSGNSPMQFTLSLSTPSASTLTYLAFTANGSATAPGDYLAIAPGATTVTFVPGDVSESLAVQIVGDTVVEPDETLILNLSDQLPGIEGGPTVVAFGTGTIVNDDVLVDVAINDVSVTEGTGAGSTNAVFTVTLSAQPPAGSPLVVNYATAGGTAISATDFTATAGTLTFSNGGALTQTISVPVTRDNIDENDEGFVVNITAPTANVTDAQGAGTILDDDAAPTPAIADISVTEGNSGFTTATFTVTLSHPSSFPLLFQAFTDDGSAQAPADYLDVPIGSAAVSFAPLQTTQTVSVDVVGELLVEAAETFVLNLSSAAPETGTPPIVASGTATIANDDSAVLGIVGSSGPEGNAGSTPRQFTVTLSNPVQAEVRINYASADGTATVADNDYQAASGTLAFPGSSTSQVINVNVVGDLEVEPDQAFTVNLSALDAPAGVTLGTASATGTIVNDDATSFSIASASVVEGTGSNPTLSFTVSLSAPAKDPVSVQYATSNGSAGAPADYLAASGTLTFASGQTTGTIAVTVIGDNLVEPDETLTVTLSGASGGTIAVGSATGTIVNDDVAGLSIDDVTEAEGNGNGTTPFVFTVSTSNPSTAPITVGYQTSDGGATAPNDYLAAGGSATIPAGAMSATLTVTVIADNVVEPDESFTVTLSGPQGATLVDPTGVGTILGDEDLVPVPTLDPRALALLMALMLAIGIADIARRR